MPTRRVRLCRTCPDRLQCVAVCRAVDAALPSMSHGERAAFMRRMYRLGNNGEDLADCPNDLRLVPGTSVQTWEWKRILTPTQAKAAYQVWSMGRTHQEAADRLGISRVAVSHRLARALAALKAAYAASRPAGTRRTPRRYVRTPIKKRSAP